jgi:hypothetical protein
MALPLDGDHRLLHRNGRRGHPDGGDEHDGPGQYGPNDPVALCYPLGLAALLATPSGPVPWEWQPPSAAR